MPIQVRGTGTNVLNANVTLDATNTSGLVIDQGNTAHAFTMNGTLTTNGAPVRVVGPGDVNLYGTINGGASSLTQNGTGTIRVNKANVYTGGTTLTFGNLLVNNTAGSGTGSGDVLVTGPSFLGGTGTVAGDVTVQNAGQLGPGAFADGHLTLGGDLTLGTASTFAYSASSAASHDLLSMNGLLSINGILDLRLTGGYVPAVGTTFTLIENASGSAVVGGFLNTRGGVYTLNGNAYRVDYAADLDGTANDVTLTRLAAVPEPAGLALLGLGGLLLRRRR